MTRSPVLALRSVDLSTPDLAAAERFYTEAWGLDVAARAGGALYLAGTGDDHHVLVLREGPPALLSTTFRTGSEDDLARLAGATAAAGCRVLAAPAHDEGPAGGMRLAVREPRGATLHFVHGDARRSSSGPVPNRPLRLAHVNVNTRGVDALASFYAGTLGFRLTDRSKLMGFVSCNRDHHAVVIAEAPVEGLNHVAFLMPDLESVMRGSGRVIDHGHPIGWGVGRHGPGDNVFAYFLDPAGIVVEYTAEVQQVDETHRPRGPAEWTWPPGRSDHWGIAPPKSEAVKAAQIAVPHGS